MKHLYIDLDDTLLPFDSFPRFLLAFINYQKLHAVPLLSQLPWLSLPANRHKIRPKVAHLLQGHTTKRVDAWSQHWVVTSLLKHIRYKLTKKCSSYSICSMSLDIVVTPLANYLGVEGIGTELKREAGHFTGQLGTICAGAGKAQLIEQDACRRRLNLKDCGLLTDHHRDIPALEIVGHHFLVNPTPQLDKWGKSKNAEVVTDY